MGHRQNRAWWVGCGLALVLGVAAGAGGGARGSAPATAPKAREPGVRWAGKTDARTDLRLYVYMTQKRAGGDAEKTRVLAACLIERGAGDVVLHYGLEGSGADAVLSWGLQVNGGFEIKGSFAAAVMRGEAVRRDDGGAAPQLRAGKEAVLCTWHSAAGTGRLCVRVEDHSGWHGDFVGWAGRPEPLEYSATYLSRKSKRGSVDAARSAVWVLEEVADGRETREVERAFSPALKVVSDYQLREAQPLLEIIYRDSTTLRQKQDVIIAAAHLGMPTAVVRLALRDDLLKAARYEAAAVLMSAGYDGARDVLLEGYRGMLAEMETRQSSRPLMGVGQLMQSQHDEELRKKVQALKAEKFGPEAAGHLQMVLSKMEANQEEVPLESLWEIAETTDYRTIVGKRTQAVEQLGERCTPADIGRIDSLMPYTTGDPSARLDQEGFERVKENAMARIRQRFWRGDE